MKYSNEEKLSIISRYQQGESIATLSDELNIPRSTLYRWLNSFPTDIEIFLSRIRITPTKSRKAAKCHYDSESR